MASTTSAQATLSFERYESHCGHARDGGRDLHLKLGKEKKQAPPQLSLSVFSRFTFSFAGLLLLSLLAWSQIPYLLPTLLDSMTLNSFLWKLTFLPRFMLSLVWGFFCSRYFCKKILHSFPKESQPLSSQIDYFLWDKENYHSNNIYLKILSSRSHKNYIHFSELKRITCTGIQEGLLNQQWFEGSYVKSSAVEVTWIRCQRLTDPRL